MKIPNKIQIAGRIVKIIRDDESLISDGLLGQSRADEDKIILLSNKAYLSTQCMEQTLIHECIHKINNILSVGSPQNSEEYVNPLSELLYQVFKQIESKN